MELKKDSSYLLYGNLPDELISMFNRHNTTPHSVGQQKIPDGYVGVKMNHNPDLVRELKLSGFKDLCMGNHSTYAHILEKGNCMIFVSKFLEAHHYFG